MAVMEQGPWTDERLDDLKSSVDNGFRDNRTEFRAMRQEMTQLRGGIHTEIGALNRTIHQFTFALVGTVFLGFMGTITAIVAQT
ncbi:MAG: hypothetical protein ACOYD4_05615 [Solirubrobacterales bacterium]